MWKNKTKGAIFGLIIGIVIALCYIACAPKYNVKKGIDFTYIKNSITEVEQDNESLIFAAFSGGGSRASAMSWEVLKRLKKIPYQYINKSGDTITSDLASQIDYVSGISGGSFAAAAWCIYKDSMDVFDKKFNEKNIQLSLVGRLFPVRFLRLLSPSYDRINVAADYYDKKVFNGMTFDKLPSYPTLWIHSTHLSLGLRFTYNQKYFDYLNSDIKTYPVGYACAASSAFPILLNPITLRNYGPTQPDSVLMKDGKYRSAKRNAHRDYDRYFYAKKVEYFNDKSNKWIHVADGGLVDNQGLQIILDQFKTNGIINKRINNAKKDPLKRIVFINVNAGLKEGDKSGKKRNAPKMFNVMYYAMTTSMDMLSAKRWEEIKLRSQGKVELMKVNGLELERPYFIEINARNLENPMMRDDFMSIPTSFNLKDKYIETIKTSVDTLMHYNTELNRLSKRSTYGIR